MEALLLWVQDDDTFCISVTADSRWTLCVKEKKNQRQLISNNNMRDYIHIDIVEQGTTRT